jgi:hypothetical protein
MIGLIFIIKIENAIFNKIWGAQRIERFGGNEQPQFNFTKLLKLVVI